MTGREKIRAAFSKEGAKEFPAVICYEDIYIRDHWKELTTYPWRYAMDTDTDNQIKWRSEIIRAIGQDWFYLPRGHTEDDIKNINVIEKPDGVFRVDSRTGEERRLYEPKIGGECYQNWNKSQAPATPEEIDSIFWNDIQDDPADIIQGGRKDLPNRLLNGTCAGLCPLVHVSSPLQDCVSIWGFAGFMLMLNDNPGLIKYTCELITSLMEKGLLELKIRGAEAVWIEECYLDMISPGMFKEFNMPYMTRVVEMIRSAGMKSVYYHTGDPAGKLEQILNIGADAVSFEESKKYFTIEIEDIVDAVRGRCTVLGNLDATAFLPVCTTDELKAEVARMIEAGRKNHNRFIVSTGSPVTPGTSADKVRLYCDLVHEMSK
jgi:hypothetical protein